MFKTMSKFQKQKTGKKHLRKNIIGLSEANTFEEAVLEWDYYYEYHYKTKMGHCACRNKIKHGYIIINRLNKNLAEVGSSSSGCCQYFPNLLQVKKILKSKTGIAKMWKSVIENIYEEITDLRQYSNDCVERLCQLYFNNISSLSISECNNYINELNSFIQHPRLLKLKNDLLQQIQSIQQQEIRAKKELLERIKRAEEAKKETEKTLIEEDETEEDDESHEEQQHIRYVNHDNTYKYGIYISSDGTERKCKFNKDDIIPSWIKIVPVPTYTDKNKHTFITPGILNVLEAAAAPTSETEESSSVSESASASKVKK